MQIKSEANPIIGPPRMVEMQVLQERTPVTAKDGGNAGAIAEEQKPVRSWAIADTASEPAIARIKKLELYAELKSAGCTTALCLKTIGGSKATYYRWLERYRRRGLESQSRGPKRVRGRQWTAQQEQQVLHLRKCYPLWGKRKRWKGLSRDQGLSLSLSTVGRILAQRVRLKRIRPASFNGRAGQAQTLASIPGLRQALAIWDARQVAGRAGAD